MSLPLPRLWPATLFAVAFGLSAVAILNTPLGVVPTFAATPLFLLVPSLAQTGPEVEWYFLGVLPRSAFAWGVFLAYFMLLGLGISGAFVLARSRSRG